MAKDNDGMFLVVMYIYKIYAFNDYMFEKKEGHYQLAPRWT